MRKLCHFCKLVNLEPQDCVTSEPPLTGLGAGGVGMGPGSQDRKPPGQQSREGLSVLVPSCTWDTDGTGARPQITCTQRDWGQGCPGPVGSSLPDPSAGNWGPWSTPGLPEASRATAKPQGCASVGTALPPGRSVLTGHHCALGTARGPHRKSQVTAGVAVKVFNTWGCYVTSDIHVRF